MTDRKQVTNVENFFWVNPGRDTVYFNEAPLERVVLSVLNTSSMDTSHLDAYRQGVEISTLKHFDAGTVKIHAGERGHQFRTTTLGSSHSFTDAFSFSDKGTNDPAEFLESTTSNHIPLSPYICMPAPQLDSRSYRLFLSDGVIDVSGRQHVADFNYTDCPTEANGTSGELQAGNSDFDGRSDVVVSVINLYEPPSPVFVDAPERLDLRWNRTIDPPTSRMKAFTDARYVRSVDTSTTYSPETIAALSLMTGSTDSFITDKQRASTSGWVYDCQSGTDSIAFGGMTY